MSAEADDEPGLSEAPEGTLDTVERAMAAIVAAPPVPVFSEGAQVGRYVLVRRLGAGAMGVVWSAHDPQLDRNVALKILRRSATGPAGSQAAARAAREARALARLVHPNIVGVYDAGLDGDTLYVVMELVDGVTLRAHLADAPRSFDEVVDAFVQAGAGLAAAHDAKLVHRDFKPDNVLVGRDGRVRVADFGLARIAGAADAPADGPTPATTPATAATGAFVGTLAYMAPEQLALGSIDHRADQFAFAVSWWGAAFGAEPFDGDSFAARAAAIAAGPAPRAGARTVPAWLVAILRRALAHDPDARFPSMHALLDAVARGRARRRRIITGALGLLAVAAVVAVAWWSRTDAATAPCEGGAAEIAQVWTPERAAAIAAAFPAHPAGQAAAARTRDRFDAYARTWAAGHRAACRATAVEHAQSPDLLDRRMVCLARARARLDALLTWMPRAGADIADDVTRAIDDLPSLDHCADVAALAALVPQPTDLGAREVIAAASRRIDELKARLLDPTRPVLATETAAALDEARAAGWAPLIAEAASAHALVLDRDVDSAGAEAMYRAAVGSALEGAADRLAAEAMADLAWVAAHRNNAEARSWVALARSMTRRLGNPPALALRVGTAAFEVARVLGSSDEAIAEANAALVLASSPDAAPGDLGSALANVALAERAAGHYDRAIPYLERAVEAARGAFGDDHPRVAERLHLLGLALFDAGRIEDTRAAGEQGLAIAEAWYGQDALPLTEPLTMLGMAHQRLGDPDTARVHFERALAIQRAHPGVDPYQAIEIEGNLAVLEAAVGRYDAAVARGAAALGGFETRVGRDDPSLMLPLLLLGYAERHLGHLDASFAHLQRAVALGEAGLGPDHPSLANPRIELGVTEIARGRIREGTALFERVIADGARDPNVDRRYVAEASLHLAEHLAESGALTRARRLATQARDLYAAIDGAAAERDAAARWLAEHPERK